MLLSGNQEAKILIDKNYLNRLVRTCGLGRWLCFGDNAASMCVALLSKGLDVRVGSIECIQVGEDDWRPGTVFCSGQFDTLACDKISGQLKRFYSVAQNSVILQVTVSEVEGQLRDRGWWEKTCFEMGFRVHPRSYHMVPYEAREVEGSLITVVLEKVAESALADYPMSVLSANRILHMDMMRETGRRGDAHCIRYHMAAEYIRPGDTVLDVACGLGYGSHILYQNSQAKSVLGVDLSEFGIDYAKANYGLDDVVQYKVGDAQNLSFLPDNSIDFIAGFETVEHVPFPAKYLSELKRVLRPAGRLMICAPNDWTDETGQDPNPHHLHVYTWERLVKECGEKFLLEKGFVQVAGGAMKCHHSPRKWKDVQLKATLDEESEWAVLLCMKDPLEGKGVPYIESAWHIPDSSDFNVSAFGRDYEYPWLVKGMVAMGMRSHSDSNLHAMRESVLKTFPCDSVDFGAALCGCVYDKLTRDALSDSEYISLISSVKSYSSIINPSPHQLRWQVSLLFAGGELTRKRGNNSEAEALYLACAEIDVLPYSPLLGNKTLDALYWLSMIALERNDCTTARRYLVRSCEEVKRLTSGAWLNISGEMEYPLPFGFAELAQLFDKASRAAYMLTSLDSYVRRPGVFAAEAGGFFERQLLRKDEELFMLTKRVQELADEVVRQDAHAQHLALQLAEVNSSHQSSFVLQMKTQLRRVLKKVVTRC